MTYAKKLQEILSDGRWHCVLDMISETGLSARNRISEMNLKHLEEKGFEKYEGKKCQLEKCTHNANLFMYKLSEEYADTVAEKSKQIIARNLHENNLDDWNNLSSEDRKKQINEMMKKAGIR